jgi:uncharacterized membrane protein YeiH
MNQILLSLDLIGTFVFAISGVISASKNKLDLFGALFLGFITAVGGGTIRDLLLGATPVSWIRDTYYLFIIILAVAVTYLFKKQVFKLRKTLFFFDTVGIGVFTILGLQKALILDVSPIVAVIMGTFSAVLGGVIRDILVNDIPLIFRNEIYATACIVGASVFLLLEKFNVSFEVNAVSTILIIIVIRLLSVKYKIGLPKIG